MAQPQYRQLDYSGCPWSLCGGKTRFDGIARKLLANATTADKIALMHYVNEAFHRNSIRDNMQLITGFEGHVTQEKDVLGQKAGGEITRANKEEVKAAHEKYSTRQAMLTPDLHSTTFNGAFLSEDKGERTYASEAFDLTLELCDEFNCPIIVGWNGSLRIGDETQINWGKTMERGLDFLKYAAGKLVAHNKYVVEYNNQILDKTSLNSEISQTIEMVHEAKNIFEYNFGVDAYNAKTSGKQLKVKKRFAGEGKPFEPGDILWWETSQDMLVDAREVLSAEEYEVIGANEEKGHREMFGSSPVQSLKRLEMQKKNFHYHLNRQKGGTRHDTDNELDMDRPTLYVVKFLMETQEPRFVGFDYTQRTFYTLDESMMSLLANGMRARGLEQVVKNIDWDKADELIENKKRVNLDAYITSELHAVAATVNRQLAKKTVKIPKWLMDKLERQAA